jgi:cell division protein ZapB
MTPAATQLNDVEDKLNQLINHYHVISNDNKALKIQQETWVQQKRQLLEKTTLARIRVEALITRLQAMEKNA